MLAVRSTADPGAAVERLRAVERRAVDGATAEEMAAGCLLLDVIERGQVVGAVALDVIGDTATITAAANWGARTYEALTLIESGLRSRGIRRLRLFTKRRGLVAALMPRGYRMAEPCEMIKEL